MDQIITDNFCLISNSYEGRDKIVKLFQYLAKFMAWYCLMGQQASPKKDLNESQMGLLQKMLLLSNSYNDISSK